MPPGNKTKVCPRPEPENCAHEKYLDLAGETHRLQCRDKWNLLGRPMCFTCHFVVKKEAQYMCVKKLAIRSFFRAVATGPVSPVSTRPPFSLTRGLLGIAN